MFFPARVVVHLALDFTAGAMVSMQIVILKSLYRLMLSFVVFNFPCFQALIRAVQN